MAQTPIGDAFRSVNFAALATAPAADPQAAPAAPPDPGYVTFFKNTELGGLVDAYYGYTNTKTSPLYRSFDTAQNTFTLSMAEIYFNKAPTSDSRVGFKLKTIWGPAAKTIIGGDDSTLTNVLEAYVSYLTPGAKGVQFDVGKFVTTAGAEVIEAKDDWNYSRGLLFQNAIPFYHSGVRVTYNASGDVTLIGGIVNGWNNTADNNTGKTVLATIIYKPTINKMQPLLIAENYIGGPEQPGTNTGWRQLSDTVLTYTATPMVSVLANYDYGKDASNSSSWQGIAAAIKFQATPVAALVPRIEYFKDTNGNQTGLAQNLTGATVTLELKGADNMMWRIEYRGDFSNVSPFVDSTGAAKKNQQSILFGFLYNFSTK